MDQLDTVVALSSGAGRAGVAVIRISGHRVRFILETICGEIPPPRLAALRRIRDALGEPIDTGLVLFFPAPQSFTGEDVAELQLHGSRAILAATLARVTSLPGVRLAEPGEFTRRAFEAGKLDLAAVEGLADLIDSETEWQRKQALRQMEGALGEMATGWRDALIQAMALVEADLDFSDEGDVSGPLLEQVLGLVRGVRDELGRALGSFAVGERVRDGFVVVLAGPPNAGKSSLLNALARRDVAIVSPVAGTTRDSLEVRLDLGGIPVVLIDTAGLRETTDEVEAEGVRRARRHIARSDLTLLLRPVDSEPFQNESMPELIRLATKADLAGQVLPGELAVSATTGAGIDALLSEIQTRLLASGTVEPALLTRERHRVAVTDAKAALDRALVAGSEQAELVAEDIRTGVRSLERLIGRIGVEDVLDQLFSGFCIGK